MIVIDWRKIGKLQFFFVLTKLMRSKGVMQYKHSFFEKQCILIFKKVNWYVTFKKEFNHESINKSKIQRILIQ